MNREKSLLEDDVGIETEFSASEENRSKNKLRSGVKESVVHLMHKRAAEMDKMNGIQRISQKCEVACMYFNLGEKDLKEIRENMAHVVDRRVNCKGEADVIIKRPAGREPGEPLRKIDKLYYEELKKLLNDSNNKLVVCENSNIEEVVIEYRTHDDSKWKMEPVGESDEPEIKEFKQIIMQQNSTEWHAAENEKEPTRFAIYRGIKESKDVEDEESSETE